MRISDWSSDVCSSDLLARPTRGAVTHLRALQALDGALAGASHREIATVLFVEAEVAARWSPDSELRAQVRSLVQRGRALMNDDNPGLLACVRGAASARAVSPCTATSRVQTPPGPAAPRLPPPGKTRRAARRRRG